MLQTVFPVVSSSKYLREDIPRIDECWAAAHFDLLPHVVHILTSKDREGAAQILKEQSDVIEEVVDEVLHSYHTGFNRAIKNYSQVPARIEKLISEKQLYAVEQCDKWKVHSNPGNCTKARLRTFSGLSKIERREAFAYRPQLPEHSRVQTVVHVFL
ncbi:unnamed protein product [Trifolium pratense]|uniref:Uncharacterized protein n=1 Tax=Trifolium pratense TaxID=57577 RepID=A0ACB0JMQ0_TRIPR|nr:unnamed protein product [Trifolium pratense]